MVSRYQPIRKPLVRFLHRRCISHDGAVLCLRSARRYSATHRNAPYLKSPSEVATIYQIKPYASAAMPHACGGASSNDISIAREEAGKRVSTSINIINSHRRCTTNAEVAATSELAKKISRTPMAANAILHMWNAARRSVKWSNHQALPSTGGR